MLPFFVPFVKSIIPPLNPYVKILSVLPFSNTYSIFPKVSDIFGSTNKALIIKDFLFNELVYIQILKFTNFVSCYNKDSFEDPQKVAKEPCHIQSALANSVRVILIITLQSIRILSEALTNINQTITKEFNAFTNILESLKSLIEGTKSLRVYEEKYKAYYQSKYQEVSKHLTNDTSPNRQKIDQGNFFIA